MTKRRTFVEDEYYHCYSRGVNKNDIFLDKKDYQFFMHLVEILNIKKIPNPSDPKKIIKVKLVDNLCITLMPNHFHFILKQLISDGISKFIQKVLSRYTLYFNNKYERTGALFESRFKDKHIDNEYYMSHLMGYIWNNPIKIIKPKYKSKDLLNGLITLSKSEIEFAKKYPYKKFPLNYSGPEQDSFIDNNHDFLHF
jgi:REP element-mobilizing transposase RayT